MGRKKTPTGPVYWVVCAEWVAGPFPTRARATSELVSIVNFGACPHYHYIDESESEGRKPRWNPAKVRQDKEARAS